MIAPVSVCHQLSWTGRPERLAAPQTHGLGVERLADAGDEPQRGQVVARRPARARPHQHPDRRRRRVPDGDLAARPAAAYQRRASNSPVVDQHRRRRWVSGAMMPYDVPVTQPGSAVHQKTSSGRRSSANARGGVVGDHGLVHVHRALGLAGRAAGEVQQRHRLPGSVAGIVELVVGRRPARSARPMVPDPAASPDDQHVLAARAACRGSARSCAGTARGVVTRTLRVAEPQPLPDRLRAEGGEQRRQHAGVLQRAERRDVQLGHPAEQREDAGPWPTPSERSRFANRLLSRLSSR